MTTAELQSTSSMLILLCCGISWLRSRERLQTLLRWQRLTQSQ